MPLLAKSAGRLVSFLLRAVGRSATTLPGRVALLVDPDLLRHLACERRVILITGTNGKTTAARMLTGILRRSGWTVVDNPAGANLDSGLATALLGAARAEAGKPSFAVLEVDEAAFAQTAAQLSPEVCIVTNIFRDQLDRYGERDLMRDMIAHGLAAAADARADRGTTFVLCADDPLCESLADPYRASSSVRIMFTGMDLADMRPDHDDAEMSDEAAHCPACGERYRYLSKAYGHLGDYVCPSCGRARACPAVRFRTVPADAGGGALFIRAGTADDEELTVPTEISILGIHNLYNAASAIAAATACGESFEQACASLSTVAPAFGRMERLSLGGRTAWMILVKNPAGMDRALEHVSAASDAGAVFFLLNSEDADGRDTSWIWDARFEDRMLPDLVFVSGRRVWDMALRLRYAGLPAAAIRAGEDAGAQLARALEALPPGRALYLLPNYTAMLELRSGALRQYGVKVFERGQKTE